MSRLNIAIKVLDNAVLELPKYYARRDTSAKAIHTTGAHRVGNAHNVTGAHTIILTGASVEKIVAGSESRDIRWPRQCRGDH